jgi:hypothetical protein
MFITVLRNGRPFPQIEMKALTSLFRSHQSLLRESVIKNDLQKVRTILENHEDLVNADISAGDTHV